MPDYRNIACPRSTAKESQLQAKKKTLFDAAGSIGKLEFLNDEGVGGGSIRKALETVAVSSNAIRVGDTYTDTSGLLDESGGGLMESMELGGSVQSAVAAFDPNAVNGAVGASKAIVARARQGNFTMDDIPTAIGEFKNIALIATKIFKPPLSGENGNDYQKFRCRPSPYATDLVHRAPKQNFQFVVEIALNPAYLESFILVQSRIEEQFLNSTVRNSVANGLSESDRQKIVANNVKETTVQLPAQLSFLIKSTSRPSATFEYEDLNYYNFRTKGIRKATFNPVTMTFIDDQLNSAAAFYAFYLSAMSPIANTFHSRNENSMVRKNHEQNGMDFTNYKERQQESTGASNTFPAYAATVGALKPLNQAESNRTKSIIDRISIYQYGKSGNTFSAYNMFSPRIVTFNPSEANMADSGEGQTLAMDIDYDYFTIQPEINIGGDEMTADAAAKLTGEDAGAFFPNRYFGDNQPTTDRIVSSGSSQTISS